MTTIYHNAQCSKSRESLALLKLKKEEILVIDYLHDVPKRSELRRIIKILKIKPFDLIRTNEKLFQEKFAQLDAKTTNWVKIMVENPRLIERPIVIKDGRAVIGRPTEKVLSIL
ncbi:MAG: arsenate reductase [Bacteroidia bacterium]|jgi:arsenate reductase